MSKAVLTNNTYAADSNEREQTRRRDEAREVTISKLAQENQADLERVRALYEFEHARLEAQAKIKTYVPVIAAKLVRTALQQLTSSRIQ